MIQFDSGRLFASITSLSNLAQSHLDASADMCLSADNHQHQKDQITFVCDELARIDLPLCLVSAKTLKVIIFNESTLIPSSQVPPQFPPGDLVIYPALVAVRFRHYAIELANRFKDEASTKTMLSLPSIGVRYYAPDAPLFGNEVASKFPLMTEDIAESGKCVALDRSTAAVFHLMRVMELALQRFGSELGITFVADKNWQNILDEVNKAIKAMDHKQLRTKALAEAASHLYNVKVAWRNEVMHPKQTYTPEEAAAIFDNTRTFVRDLAGLL